MRDSVRASRLTPKCFQKGSRQESKPGAPAGRARGLLPEAGLWRPLIPSESFMAWGHWPGMEATCQSCFSLYLEGATPGFRPSERAGLAGWYEITDVKCSGDRTCHTT